MITAQHKILFLKYGSFSVGSESDKYRLRISGYDKSSNTGECITRLFVDRAVKFTNKQ